MGREIKLMRQLSHSGIVVLKDWGEVQGQVYMVMEKVDGETLRNCLMSRRLTRPEALRYCEQLLEALSYAHSQEVMHRDLKPENLMVQRDGRLRLLDFGFSRNVHQNTFQTLDSSVAGTPAYMAPEQLLGNPCFGSDVYALGVILYVMVRGTLPFGGGDVVAAHLSMPAPPLCSGADWLDALCASMLEKSVSRRVASVSDVLQSLRANHLTVMASSEKTTIISQQRNP